MVGFSSGARLGKTGTAPNAKRILCPPIDRWQVLNSHWPYRPDSSEAAPFHPHLRSFSRSDGERTPKLANVENACNWPAVRKPVSGPNSTASKSEHRRIQRPAPIPDRYTSQNAAVSLKNVPLPCPELSCGPASPV